MGDPHFGVPDVTIVARGLERGSSNSHPSLKYETPEVGTDWWWWNSALGLWEWVRVKSVNDLGEGLVVLDRGIWPDVVGRVSTIREGWGYEPVTERDRDVIPLRDLFPEARQGSLLA